jgi:hypothetical protein
MSTRNPIFKSDVINSIKAGLAAPEGLHKNRFVKISGRTSDRDNQLVQEVAADLIFQEIGKYENIKEITRQASYLQADEDRDISKRKKGAPSNETLFSDKLENSKLNFCHIGRVVGREVPIKNTHLEKGVGKIDLVFKCDSEILLVELKGSQPDVLTVRKPTESGTFLSAILQISTYFRQLNHKKFLSNFSIRIGGVVPIIPAILVPKGGKIYKQYSVCTNTNRLRKKLGVRFFTFDATAGIDLYPEMIEEHD